MEDMKKVVLVFIINLLLMVFIGMICFRVGYDVATMKASERIEEVEAELLDVQTNVPETNVPDVSDTTYVFDATRYR